MRDLAQMVRFYSRLPVPRLAFESDAHALPDFRTAPRMVALAGFVIGMPAALVLWLAAIAGLPAYFAASLAVAAGVIVTGAFHEDGLADTFDGLAGGATPEKRLDIMKDSRIGAFGGSALVLGILLRVTGLAGLLDAAGFGAAALLMLAAASLSRSLGLAPLAFLPASRPGGFSSSVGRPTMTAFLITLSLSCVMTGAIAGLTETNLAGTALAIVLAALPVFLLGWWAMRTIHGQTGDIAGASQQLSEIAFYAGLLIVLAGSHD